VNSDQHGRTARTRSFCPMLLWGGFGALAFGAAFCGGAALCLGAAARLGAAALLGVRLVRIDTPSTGAWRTAPASRLGIVGGFNAHRDPFGLAVGTGAAETTVKAEEMRIATRPARQGSCMTDRPFFEMGMGCRPCLYLIAYPARRYLLLSVKIGFSIEMLLYRYHRNQSGSTNVFIGASRF
jgi:hypothetical protein